ncbi:DsbA family protein, partial [Candidatus Gracilibacteria bacterium]|nr:DsbA family protein [Candidatus Gracilibacteria bacterium]
GAEILECIGREGGANAYNAVMSETLISKDSSESAMLALAIEQGLDEATIQSCLDNGETEDIVAERFAAGTDVFGVTGTPGNVIINNQTGEYTLVSGAVPAASFETVIDSLLQ